jgi:type I restriction enzyme R subunit
MSSDTTKESVFQNDMIKQFVANGWLLGTPENYNRELALYGEDLLGFVKETQDGQWQKYCKLYPDNPEQKFLERVASQLNKADPNAADKEMRTFGTLGVLRHELRDRGTRFRLCQFRPEHDLNPDTLARYQKNRLRVVPELVYSPWAAEEHLAQTGAKSKAWRIDLVLFVNGLPVATLELKSEFKQAVQNAIKQYKTTRLPVDPATRKPEPLLTFKRGALVHFAVSQASTMCLWPPAWKGKTPSFCRLTKGPETVGPVMMCRRMLTGMRQIICGMRFYCPITC